MPLVRLQAEHGLRQKSVLGLLSVSLALHEPFRPWATAFRQSDKPNMLSISILMSALIAQSLDRNSTQATNLRKSTQIKKRPFSISRLKICADVRRFVVQQSLAPNGCAAICRSTALPFAERSRCLSPRQTLPRGKEFPALEISFPTLEISLLSHFAVQPFT